MTATLQTLGRVELRAGPAFRDALVPLQPKRLALLAYLAVAQPRGPQPRERLMALFWPEASDAEARQALRQALHHLRQRIGPQAIASSGDGRVTLDPSSLTCDAAALEDAASAGDDDRVLRLYQGHFLDGFFPRDVAQELDEWIDRTRQRLRALAATAARRAAGRAAAEGRIEEAIGAAERGVEVAPDDESALRTLLLLLERAGRTTDALAVGMRAARDVEQRLGVSLAPETRSLLDAMRARHGSAATRPPQSTIVADAPTPIHIGSPALRSSPVRDAVAPPRIPWRSAVAVAVALPLAALVLTVGGRQGDDLPHRTALTAAPAGAADRSVDRLFVVDFADDGDGMGATVAAALRVDLAQSPTRRVLSGAQVAAAIRRLAVPSDAALDDSLARALAIREGIKGFVTGTANRAGRAWLLTGQLISAANGDVLAVARADARDSTDLVPAIERLSRALTARLDRALARTPVVAPLAQVTTSSVEALRAYGDGVRQIDAGERMAGIAQLERAVALDSAFATAWRVLGATWAGLDEAARAREALEHAYRHRDRLPTREQLLVAGSYHRNVTHDLTAAATAYRAVLGLYPSDLAATNNLALTYVSMGAHASAESLLARVIIADSMQVNAYLTLAEQLAMQGRHAEAGRVMADAVRRFPDHPVVRLTPIYLASSAQRWQEAESLAVHRAATDLTGVQRADALQTLARIEMVRGRVARAATHLDSSLALAWAAGSTNRYLGGSVTKAWLELRFLGRPLAARAALEQALLRVPSSDVAASPVLPSLLVALLATGQSERVAALVRDTSAVAPAVRRPARGLILAATGRPAAAAAVLAADTLSARACPVCLLPMIAFLRAAAGDTIGAIRAAEDYLRAPWIFRFETDAADLAETLVRLAAWYEARGAANEASATWRRLLDLWVDADPVLESRIMDTRRHLISREPLPSP